MSVPKKTYTNTLREQQAAQTRARILDATVALLAEVGDSEIAMQQVADRAGVSLRTVYRNFPTRDALLEAVVNWISEQFGQRMGTFPSSPSEFSAMTDMVHLVFELEPLYRALFASPGGRAAHIRSNADRIGLIQKAFSAELEGLGSAQRRRFAAVMYLVESSNGALFMHDYAGLSPDEVVRALRWATTVLADAVGDPIRRKEL